MTTEKYDSLLLVNKNLITGGTLEILKVQISEEILPKVVEEMLKVEEQMPRVAVH